MGKRIGLGGLRWSLGLCLFGMLLLLPARARAAVPWPDGCTLTTSSTKPALQIWLQQGLDTIFLGACSHHDRCYAQCNGESPPFLDGSHKTSCDVTLLIEMEDACTLWASLLTFPIDDDLQTADDFILYCNGGLAPGIFGAVSLFGDGAYAGDQCTKGCNPNYCPGQTVPSTCGGLVPPGPNTYSLPAPEAPGVCYIRHEFNPPPDPIFPPPILACQFVSCCSYSCTALQEYCCGGCNYGFWNPYYGPGGCGSPWDPWGPWGPWDPWDPWNPWDPWGPWGPWGPYMDIPF